MGQEPLPHIQVIGGNIATAEAALALGHGCRRGQGRHRSGSICTTRIIAGVGVPQITAIDNVATALEGSGVPMIADGGIRFSGDISKAIAAGANAVMLGGLFAGTEESPGETVLSRAFLQVLSRHGFARRDAAGSADRYFQETDANIDKLVPEGIEGRFPTRHGHRSDPPVDGGLRASMGYVGCANIEQMRTTAEFVEITSAGIRESHVHDVQITKGSAQLPRD